MQDPKNRQKFVILAPSHNFVGYIFATKARRLSTIGKKLVKQQCLTHMSSKYGELRHKPTSG